MIKGEGTGTKAEKRSGTDLEGFSIKEMGAYAIDLSSSLVPILFTLQAGRKVKKDLCRSSRHCGNVYNWTLYGTVGNDVCRVWES